MALVIFMGGHINSVFTCIMHRYFAGQKRSGRNNEGGHINELAVWQLGLHYTNFVN